NSLPGDIRGTAVDRLVKRFATAKPVDRAERCGWQHTKRARRHRSTVGKNIPKDVAGDHHVKLSRLPDDLHRGIINIEVRQLDVGELVSVQRGDLFAP